AILGQTGPTIVGNVVPGCKTKEMQAAGLLTTRGRLCPGCAETPLGSTSRVASPCGLPAACRPGTMVRVPLFSCLRSPNDATNLAHRSACGWTTHRKQSSGNPPARDEVSYRQTFAAAGTQGYCRERIGADGQLRDFPRDAVAHAAHPRQPQME